MENLPPEEVQKMFEQGVRGLPMPPTFKIPKTLEELNQCGSTFSQTNIQWLWSQIATVVSVANIIAENGKELKGAFKGLSDHVMQLNTNYRIDIDEHRRAYDKVLDQNAHLMEERGDMIVGDMKYKRELTKSEEEFKEKTRDNFTSLTWWLIGLIIVGNLVGPLLVKILFKL